MKEEWIQKIAEGDRDTFRDFYKEAAGPVYSFILSLTRDAHEAEDLMQDTFLCVWDRAGDYEPQGKPLAWVFTIARHLCYMRFRQRRRETELSEWDKEGDGEIYAALEQAPERKVLSDALAALREEDRQIVLLHAAAGLKHREVASALGLPLATELSKYNRSMKKLQKILQK